MKYKELNLKNLREEADLDFAHFTYQRGQCSCCYGPEDLPARYWRDGKKKRSDYTYILFKNADNGSGTVRREDEITNYTCVSYRFRDSEQRDLVCRLLAEQLDETYVVLIPANSMFCIVIYTVEGFKREMDGSRIQYRQRFEHVQDIPGHASIYRDAGKEKTR